ncbi:glycosyltransferase family 4 protein [Yoonia sp.]|uniref:glycosyltransferase family 4 protein n=1 Tax=Yoonia sp. TaxID=2212373 RepID=UPI0019FF356C|nr:glycosyltransferase family 4 protein [Yoonia sp.]MBE0414690.1 glycosyltransferase family 4 protein [Yoonia sp.]
MKITFICPVFGLNGGHRVVATYARHLQARGHEVTIVSQAARPPSFRAKVKDILGWQRLKAKTMMPLTGALQDRHIVISPPGPPAAEDIPDADIIIATWWETAEWVAALPASKGRKFYLLQDYEVFPYLPVDRVKATYGLPLKKIAVSSYIRDEIAKNHATTGVDVIPNAVDLAQFNAPSRSRNTSLTVGFLYTATPRKNVQLAIDAITLAKARLPDLQVKVFGSHPPEDTLPLPAWVDYQQAPPQEDIPKIYAACDAWLFTSEKEGFGLPILEAMACRTPVLATRAGAAPDMIDGTNGKLLPALAQAFADEIQHFAQMPDAAWQVYSDAAWRTATSYTWENATDRLLDLFNAPGAPECPALLLSEQT